MLFTQRIERAWPCFSTAEISAQLRYLPSFCMEKLVESASDIALDVGSFREVILSPLDAIPFVTEMRCWRDHKAGKIDCRAIEHREHRKDRTLDAITAWFFEPLPVWYATRV